MDESTKKQILEAIETHRSLINELEVSGIETIAAIADAIKETLKHDGRVYICGNGGSAADAQHIAGELVGRFERERKALRGSCTDNQYINFNIDFQRLQLRGCICQTGRSTG